MGVDDAPAPIPWVKRVWALPFLTVLAPSEGYNEQHRRHKKITDWGRQMIRQLRRWLPGRSLVVVADSSYAVLELLACAAHELRNEYGTELMTGYGEAVRPEQKASTK